MGGVSSDGRGVSAACEGFGAVRKNRTGEAKGTVPPKPTGALREKRLQRRQTAESGRETICGVSEIPRECRRAPTSSRSG